MKDVSEQKDPLWAVIASPLIWAAHFCLCYGTAALACARFRAPDGSLASARTAIVVYTAVSLIAIAWVAWRGHRRFRIDPSRSSIELDTAEDRYRFLALSSLLLSGLSAIAIMYEALAIVFLRDCR